MKGRAAGSKYSSPDNASINRFSVLQSKCLSLPHYTRGQDQIGQVWVHGANAWNWARSIQVEFYILHHKTLLLHAQGKLNRLPHLGVHLTNNNIPHTPQHSLKLAFRQPAHHILHEAPLFSINKLVTTWQTVSSTMWQSNSALPVDDLLDSLSYDVYGLGG